MDYDVVVIGAGPAGSICARRLDELRQKVLLVEEKQEGQLGKPANCAGLFSASGLKRLEIEPDKSFILNKVRGARFFSADGNSAEINGDEDKAYVVDRAKFDQYLASLYNGEKHFGEKCEAVKKTEAGYGLKVGKETLTSKKIVFATGIDYALPKSLGFIVPEKFIQTIQYEFEGLDIDPEFVELHLGSVAPGFFAWVIPTGEEKARVGLGVLDASKKPLEYMEAFLNKLKIGGRFKEKNTIIEKSGGPIPLFASELGWSVDDAYVVGDAGWQVKATTGGGVIMGGICARRLAECIASGGDYNDATSDIRKELGNHLMARRVANKFGDEEYSHMMDFLKKPDIREMLEKEGDMDFVGPLIKAAMKNPMMLMKMMGSFGKFF